MNASSRRTSLAVAAVSFLAAVLPLSSAAQTHASAGSRRDSNSARLERIRRIENGFAPISIGANQPPLNLDLQQLMVLSNVTELTIAVIDNYRIDWAKGYGVMANGKPVNPHTLFQACSITKPVSALAALRLVQEGKLSLDQDVNVKLKSWKLPSNQYTQDQKVTLRRIFTHTGGTTVHGFPGYAPGQPLPTLLQILDGVKPANNEPIRVDYVPGSAQRYSGGGFMVLQQLMIDVTSKPYPQILRDLVINPLGLKDSTYEEPLPASRAQTAAGGLENDGEPLPGKRDIDPELACCALWTTPSDLGRIGIEIALSEQGKANHILSESMAREMLRPQLSPTIQSLEGPPMNMGLGWMLGGKTHPGLFEHSGVNTGFSAQFLMWDSGYGVIVMENSSSFLGQCVMRYLINNVAKEYGWNYRFDPYTPWPYADTIVLAAAKLHGANAAIAEYEELKKRWAEEKGKPNQSVVWASNPPDYGPNEWDLLGVAQAIADPAHLNDAIALMETDVRDYPDSDYACHVLGGFYVQAGQKQHAGQLFQEFLKRHPGDAMITDSLRALQ